MSDKETVESLTQALLLSLRYLEHPDVKRLPFAVRSETVAMGIRNLLQKISLQKELNNEKEI